MHILTFAIKRSHLVSQRLLQRFAARAALTPARFDLMFVLQRNGLPMVQSEIARWLGVSRVTVCKMVRRMRDAGLLEVTVDSADRRRRRVSLTPFGKKCYAKLDEMRLAGKIARAVRAVWRTARLSRYEVWIGMIEIRERLARYCRGLGDHVIMDGNDLARGYGYD